MRLLKHILSFTHPLFILVGCVITLNVCGCKPLNGLEKKEIVYEESKTDFANPERGFKYLTYFEHAPFKNAVNVKNYQILRQQKHITLHQHCYYLADYMDGDIAQEYLDALDKNMQGLREAGCKCILRFAYKYSEDESNKPFDPSPEIVSKHIDQLAPYIKKNADVIFCMEAGFIGVWGEWGNSTEFRLINYTDEEYAPRWELLNHLMDVLPSDRQISVRTPLFKQRYLKSEGVSTEPLTLDEAYLPTHKARLGGHNDCFVSNQTDWGTFRNTAERLYWKEDTRYTVMGGEICQNCSFSDGPNAVTQMENFHFTYLDDGTWNDNKGKWIQSGNWNDICIRMGYRFVLEKAYFPCEGIHGQDYEIDVTIRNDGFASPVNQREVELIFVNKNDENERYIYPQTEFDPRFWEAGEKQNITLKCVLDKKMQGEYKVYLNLPDPYPVLHDMPEYSIRLGNKYVWQKESGYNHLATIYVK